MTDAGVAADTARAEEARAQLIRDIRQIKKMGDQMIQKTETAIHKAPVLLGLGAVGIALVGAAVYASRAGSGRTLHPRIARERSFFAEAARSAALSALGILAGRITQRLLTAAMNDATLTQPHAAE
ncbi:MAG: hypothetical protein ABI488_06560 [Polyangiaceae bacterium]